LSADDHLQIALYLTNQPKSIKWLKSWLPPGYDHKNIYSLLTRLKTRQLISQSATGQFLLSAIGRNRLLKLCPLLSGRPMPLGYLFIAILDFNGPSPRIKKDKKNQEDKRVQILTKILRRWGWGRLARGIYLTGSQTAAKFLKERLLELRLSEKIIQGKLAVDENQKNTADRVFNLTARNSDWRLIIDRINEWERIGASEKGLRIIRKDFLILLVTEPSLPRDLLPESYWMEEATEMVKNG